MHLDKTISITFFLFLFGTCLQAEPAITIIPDNYDFGQISQGDLIDGAFTISISGSADTQINILTGCSCISVSQNTITLTPESSADVFWKFDSTKYSGNVSFDILIMDGSNPYEFRLSGTVIETGSERASTSVWIVATGLLLIIVTAVIGARLRKSQSRENVSR